MRDSDQGRVEGLLMALLVCEKNKKNPKKIQGELVEIIHKAGIEIANRAIECIAFDFAYWEKNHNSKAYRARVRSES